jgi:hypothetical protein
MCHDISWVILILDIISIHREYVLRLRGMLYMTALKIRDIYIIYPYIDITSIEERLNIYGQCTYRTFSVRCRHITDSHHYCRFHSEYIVDPNGKTICRQLYTSTPLASSLIHIVSTYIY